MELSILIINIMLICFSLIIAQTDKENKLNKVEKGLIILSIFTSLMTFLYYIIQTILTDIPIMHFLYLRIFLVFAFLFAISIILYIKFDEELKEISYQDILNKVIGLGTVIFLILIVWNEIKITQVKEGGYVYLGYIANIYEYSSVNITSVINLVALILTTIILIIYIVKREVFSKTQKIIAFSFSITYIIIAIVYYAINGFSFSAMIYLGQTTTTTTDTLGISASSNIINVLFDSILSNPIILITIVLMVFGAIPRSFPSGNPYFKYIGNLSISFLPLMIWIMMLTGTIATPTSIDVMFVGFEFFGKIFYLLIVGMVFILIISMIVVFTSLTF